MNDEELLEALRAVRAGEPVALGTLGHLLAADFVRRSDYTHLTSTRFSGDPEYMLTRAGIDTLRKLEAEGRADRP
jgi:hypothetical protein